MATLVGVAQDQGVHGQCVLEVFWDTWASKRQAIAVAQYIGAYEVDLIHKVSNDNMVCDALSERGEFQAINTI